MIIAQYNYNCMIKKMYTATPKIYLCLTLQYPILFRSILNQMIFINVYGLLSKSLSIKNPNSRKIISAKCLCGFLMQ